MVFLAPLEMGPKSPIAKLFVLGGSVADLAFAIEDFMATYRESKLVQLQGDLTSPGN